MVRTGAKSEKDSKRALNKVVEELRNHGIPISNMPSIKIQNIVASVILGGAVDLENADSKLKRVMYEPEQFPGAIYQMELNSSNKRSIVLFDARLFLNSVYFY
mgnify:CR=1 FL=1